MIIPEQLSRVLGAAFLLTFQEQPGDVLTIFAVIFIPLTGNKKMKLIPILIGIHPILRILLVIILAIPEIFRIKDVKDGQWRYLRIKFKLWPGQHNIIEETSKQKVVQVLKIYDADYASWMIAVIYKVE